jgi:uncharacterized membrane protein YeaQ/YmgE (transglycosylase-associated protein family)
VDILFTILIGFVIGWLGRMVAGRDVNLLLTIIIGIVSVMGGFYITTQMGSGSRILGYVVGVIVAAVIIVIVGRMSGSRSNR